jgi:diguanylate cyclase (GGDEF)-like protein
MHLYSTNFVILVPYAFYIPIVALYAFKGYLLPNFISLVGAFILYLHRGNVSAGDALGYSIGMISSSISYSIIAYLLNRLREERDKYHKLSITDSLTGLPILSHTLTIGQKLIDSKEPIALAMADLNRFKGINDTYGHLVGNSAIIFFVKVLKEALSEYDYIIGRLGGDEFVIIIKNVTSSEGNDIAASINKCLKNNTFITELDKQPIRLTCSVGISHSADRENLTIETLMHEADMLMYDNKNK